MMANVSLTCISVFLIVSLISCSESLPQDLLKFNEVTNKFAWNLYKEVKQPSGNTIVSPIALQLLLDILLQGANGTTADEIAQVLQHEIDDKSILNAYKEFLEAQYHKNKTSAYSLAATIAIDQSFHLLEEAQINKHLSEYFKSEIKTYNFKENPMDSRNDINKWVLNRTDGEIKTLLPEGSIDASTEAVMVSGTVFKGVWKHKFNKRNTKPQSFHSHGNGTVLVKMMGQTGGRFRYMWNSNYGVQVVELPYTDPDFRMIIILPENVELDELESTLTYENLFEVINSVRDTNVDVYVPKFKIKKSIKLANTLKEMGMETAFTRHADFSKMTNSSVSVTNVIQKAMIMVNEKGARAAAGSGIVISAKTLPPQMICDRPFLFLILKGDTILFIGNLRTP